MAANIDPPRVGDLPVRLIADHRDLVNATERSCLPALGRLIELACGSLRSGGKLLFFGNGGSAADAQHLATELTVRYLKDRPALAALALTTDTSTLTAAANDVGFEQIFARQVEALGRAGDVAIGISTSGRSPNVLLGLETARERGLTAAGFTGAGGDAMARVADPLLVVPSDDTPRVQEMHLLLGHILCHVVESEFS